MKMQKSVIFKKKDLKINMLKINICNLKYSVPKKIYIVFHNGSNFDYHFIMKELAEEFEGQFICLGKNTEIYITFSIPIEKEVARIDKNGK